MISIRPDQFDALDAAHASGLPDAILTRLRAEFPERSDELARPGARELVESDCRGARGVAVTEADDLYRFARLRYLAVERGEPAALEMAARTLANKALPAKTRLDFVEHNLLGPVPTR